MRGRWESGPNRSAEKGVSQISEGKYCKPRLPCQEGAGRTIQIVLRGPWKNFQRSAAGLCPQLHWRAGCHRIGGDWNANGKRLQSN